MIDENGQQLGIMPPPAALAIAKQKSLDLVEILMSCEERFGVEIPNRAAEKLATVGDAVRCVQAQLEAATMRQARSGLEFFQ